MLKIPKKFQSSLWSYDLAKIDPKKNSALVITQLLNYGGEEGRDWVFDHYTIDQIKNILVHPQRGVWQRVTLKSLLGYFDITIDPLEFEMAIRNLMMPQAVIKEFWKRKELDLYETSVASS